MKIFHGTSAEGYANIRDNGWNSQQLATWSVSDTNRAYFFSNYGLDEDDFKDDYNRAIMAIDQATIYAALSNSQSKELYCIEYDVDESIIGLDLSVEYPGDSVEVEFDDLNLIKPSMIWVSNSYIPIGRAWYLSSIWKFDLLNIYDFVSSKADMEFIKACSNNYDLYELLSEHDPYTQSYQLYQWKDRHEQNNK
jgi:hypothetical protein